MALPCEIDARQVADRAVRYTAVMVLRVAGLAAVLLVASAAASEAIYKYRQADGQVLYSNQRIPGAVVL